MFVSQMWAIIYSVYVWHIVSVKYQLLLLLLYYFL